MKHLLKACIITLSLTLAFASINVVLPNSIYFEVNAKSASLNRSSLTLIRGNGYTLKVSNNKKKITWSSSNKKIATVSSKGYVKGIKTGTVTIRAKISGKTFSCKVRVESPYISKSSVSIVKDKTYRLSLKGNTQKVTWSSSNKSIAKVSSNGTVTGVKAGKTYVYAKVGSKSYRSTITITNPPVKEYRDGKYLVGKTLPAGEYVLYSTSKYGGSVIVSKNASSSISSIIRIENFNKNEIIKVTNGQYVTLARCRALKVTSSTKINSTGEGRFRVGIDIAPGDYVIYSTDKKYGGSYVVSKDIKTVDTKEITSIENFNTNTIVRLVKGQYLGINRAKAVRITSSTRINTSSEGTFRVGIDLKAGTYRLQNTSKYGAYYEIRDSIGTTKITKNGNFNGTYNIEVKNGQILKLKGCKIIK